MRSSASRSGSSGLRSFARLLRIFWIGLRFGLHEFVPRYSKRPLLRVFAGRRGDPRGRRLREALETLGPIFVKFGQVLSTRRDLVPPDIADELAQAAGPGAAVRARTRASPRSSAPTAGRSTRCSSSFEAEAGRERLGRPGALRDAARRTRGRGQGPAARHRARGRAGPRAARDGGAAWSSFCGPTAGGCGRARWWPSSRAISTTSSTSCVEAANASQLRRNFEGSPLLLVPEVHWDSARSDVMVMERMRGTPISQVAGAAREGRRHPGARARRSRDLLHAGVPRRFLPRRHASRATSSSPPKAKGGATSRSISASWAR